MGLSHVGHVYPAWAVVTGRDDAYTSMHSGWNMSRHKNRTILSEFRSPLHMPHTGVSYSGSDNHSK